jgi:hypothetical protein
LPNQNLVENRFEREPLLVSPENDHSGPTWADSIFQRIYGKNGLVDFQNKLDATDFSILFTARDRCAELDVNRAKALYLKTRLPPAKYDPLTQTVRHTE